MTRSLVMAAIGVGMTVFVYGLVGVIVKLDDFGMLLMRQKSTGIQTVGQGLIAFYALVHARFERGGYACHVPCRRRSDCAQLGLFA